MQSVIFQPTTDSTDKEKVKTLSDDASINKTAAAAHSKWPQTERPESPDAIPPAFQHRELHTLHRYTLALPKDLYKQLPPSHKQASILTALF